MGYSEEELGKGMCHMKDDQNSKSKDMFWFFMILFAIIFICIPWGINSLLMISKFNTADGVGNADWLNFGGTYVGSGLGVIVTFLAFMYTFRQNAYQNKDIEEQNKIMLEQNRMIQEQNIDAQALAKEQMRLQSLPFINAFNHDPRNLFVANDFIFDTNGTSVNHEVGNHTTLHFTFGNIGVGPAINVSISSANLGHFATNTEKCFSFNLPIVDGVDILSFEISFYDREDRKYKQTMVLKRSMNTYKISTLAAPELI